MDAVRRAALARDALSAAAELTDLWPARDRSASRAA
jgi:hypothetical protein